MSHTKGCLRGTEERVDVEQEITKRKSAEKRGTRLKEDVRGGKRGQRRGKWRESNDVGKS